MNIIYNFTLARMKIIVYRTSRQDYLYVRIFQVLPPRNGACSHNTRGSGQVEVETATY